ncbi:RNA 2'-phosphotransferase [Flammeovirga sp. OC4]|uniref:RNA 2'-phosphotransferase n=1 Tax=Flammeovirga sp. OC4 TaxID=1382345 RepID=UPI003529C804
MMTDEKKLKRTSKLLSLVLRHKPQTIAITLDENGWTDVEILMKQLEAYQHPITLQELEFLVENNNKKRFSFNEDKTMIRANQGHSVNVDLNLQPITPPSILYHGTAEKFLKSIREKGLIKKNRHHVHLSADIETARSVGQRHGKVVIFEVNTQKMLEEGVLFFKSENNVWLTDTVPFHFLKQID